MTEKKKIWFPAKAHGWGWGPPVCWQGWVVLLVFTVLIVTAPMLVAMRTNLVGYFSYIFSLVAILIFICWKKGEPPKWRRGGK
jgi:hypothetical protein